MKYLKSFNENKNLGILYHFTSISNLVSIIELDRLFSTTMTKEKQGIIKGDSTISFTRNKFLFKDKPMGLSWGVRLCFDGEKLANDFKINAYKFSTNWEENEEVVITIGSWSNRPKLKKHQIFNLKKYLLSVDLIPKDIYKDKKGNYDIKDYQKAGIDVDEEDYKFNNSPKKSLVDKIKRYVELKGFKCRIIGEKYNKKAYLSDKSLYAFENNK